MIRSLLASALAILTLLMYTGPLMAFPIKDKPIRIVVPFPAGGSTDVMAREVGARLAKSLGVPVIVENKSGASTAIGAAEVARAPADGHTLLYTSLLTHALNPHLMKSRPYNTEKDFTPIAGVTQTSLVLMAHVGMNVSNLQEFLAAAKPGAGKVSYGSIGLGSVAHLYGAYLAKTAGVEMIHVPYRGSAPATLDLLSGQVNSIFDPMPAALQKLATNKVRAIAIASQNRSTLLPEVPTLQEQGISGLDSSIWIGLFGPGNLPEEVTRRLGVELTKILQNSEVQMLIARNGEEPLPLVGNKFSEFVGKSNQTWGHIIKRLGVKLDE